VLTLATLILTGWFAVRREWRFLLILLAAVLGETLLSSGLKSMFDRPRPDIVPHLVHVSSKSFPSGHASSAAAIFLTLAALIAAPLKDRPARLYVFAAAGALAFLVGASRVYLGVHYPTDVIGGWSFGAAWAAIVWIAARRFRR
jgi:undecaprenyl-diphosphatase